MPSRRRGLRARARPDPRARAGNRRPVARDEWLIAGVEFAHADPSNDPPYVAHYGAAPYAGVTGRALADLAMLGRDPAQVTGRPTAAIAGYPAGSVRGRVIAQVKPASLTMATGDPVEADTIGTVAVDAAGAVRSRRVADGLRELARHATRHPWVGEVAALCQRIATANPGLMSLARGGGSLMPAGWFVWCGDPVG